ncbi:hypothetical protein BDZ90DRAFT_232111 [Jaminaea rosea]|uniref:P-loop containing nucleoside triphosphate hydrolase protein n=1 Tax=Jaminaea rosea TaxID=1569628 RepID=A0A316UQZ4_9BASI|nr:hypothetical protein BDZ90DRAFT_232111 [Jaminaea rosea]PWN27706.1 hypothetical protein BDZ90DRAFT_232111 [Jaminaea rosea]
MSGNTSNDPFEIVDDPTELIRARNNGEGSSSSSHRSVILPGDAGPSNGRSSDSASEQVAAQRPSNKHRALPAGFSSSSSSNSAIPSKQPLQSSSRPSASSSSSSRIWIPPPRPWEREMKEKAAAAVNAMSTNGDTRGGFVLPTIGGSGARVPTEMLDSKGEFRPPPKPAIDLTADDSDGDEPELVKIKNGDIVADEVKNNGSVCLGVIEATVFCMYGVPEPIAVDGPAAMDPSQDRDPLWQRSNWPEASRFITHPGYRPIYARLSQPLRPNFGSTSANWSSGGSYAARQNADPNPEITVSPILSPLAFQREQGRQGIPIHERNAVPHVKESFGILSGKYANALAPLIKASLVTFEARCRIRSRASAGGYAHSCDILVFCARPKASYVVESLAQAGISFVQPQPGHYSPYDYNGEPPLVKPNNGYLPQPAQTAGPSRGNFAPAMFYGGGDGGVPRYVQSKEMTEEERRKQIETVYDQLTAGEDLPLTDPSSLVVTPLFPHQKQGLTFLLDRERERSFEEAGDAREAGSSRTKRIDLTAETGDLTKDTVGLWKVVRSQVDGSIRAYRNVLTQQEQEKEPGICRGAILADDMGLGKTITVISVIASTMTEAKAFGRGRPNAAPGDVGAMDEDSDTDDEDDGGFASMAAGLQGAGANKKAKVVLPSSKKPGKKAQAKDALERARRDNLVAKSRATLIVAPLTIVANWEEQIKEHWAKKSRPSVYIYHGSNRSSDPKMIANHDVVLTTYSTLASEFSRQSIWVDTTEGAAKGGDDEAADDGEDDFEMYDDEGRPISSSNYNGNGTGASNGKGKGKKRKKATGGKEAPNPLQRIEWFRIVLDEAHTIKEVRTMQCRAVCNLSAQRRLSLTGTPVQNRLDDLYAQIKFLRLEPFSDRLIWNEHCGQRQKKSSLTQRSNANQNNEPLERIALVKVQTMMKFLTLRRTKETRTASGKKLLELPAKNVRVVTIDFDERERTKYKELHERYKEDFKEMEATNSVGTNYATILQEISNLRICCDDPSLVDASKDNKRRTEGRSGFVDAIREDGMTRERAAGLFEVYSESEEALCWECGADIARFAEGDDTGVRGEAATDEAAGSRRPVVTRCTHIICSRCFASKVPAYKKPKALTAEDRADCPACDTSLALLTDIVQLDPADLAGPEPDARHSKRARGGADDFDWGDEDGDDEEDRKGSKRSAHHFGCDRLLPIDSRIGLSHKTRWLLSDLLPFSQCNRRSMLYDADAPQIEHHTPTEQEKDARPDLESVVAVPRQSTKSEDGAAYRPIKSVVFSQWTSMLDRVERALYRAGIKTVRLDGTMKRPERAAALERFKSDASVEVFLISLRAGGFGLNLVSACRAYCLEPAWNPAQEQQAMDRVHRLGQVVPVISTKVVTRASIEERMLEVQKRKAELASAVAEGRKGQQKSRAEEKADRRKELATLMG